MRYKALVLVTYDTDHNNEHVHGWSPKDDLKGLLSQMDEAGRLNVESDILMLSLAMDDDDS